MAIIFAFILFFTNYDATNSRQEGRVEWLTPMSHDFGTIRQNRPVKFKFQFKNISDQPLTIDNVRTPCSCTAPDWDEMVIAPQAKSSIDITFDAAKEGEFKHKITVWLHGQKKPEKLYIEGTVE